MRQASPSITAPGDIGVNLRQLPAPSRRREPQPENGHELPRGGAAMMLADSGDMVGRTSDLLARPVREKPIRPAEVHLVRAGEGSDARLGVCRHIGSPSRGKWVTYLDTGYTNDSDPVYPIGDVVAA